MRTGTLAISSAAHPPHRVAWCEWGEQENPDVAVCVHGLTRNGRDFDDLARTLSSSHRVICPDMPGRGNSEWLPPEQYHYGTYVSDLLSLLAALGISRAHWVGTSMGGILGMMLAGAAPGLIRRMVLNDVGSLIPAAGLRRILAYAGVRMAFGSRNEAEAALRENLAPWNVRAEEHWQHLFRHGIMEDNGLFRFAYDPAITSSFGQQKEVTDVDLSAPWQAVTCPVLLLRGAFSDILTRETADRMRHEKPGVTLVEIEGAGHAPALMEDDQVDLIQEWLRATPAV